MNIGKLFHNSTNRAVQKNITDGPQINNKCHDKQNTASARTTTMNVDSVGSVPEIEYYCNYSKDGVLADTISAQQPSQAEPATAMTAVRSSSGNMLGVSPDWSIIPHKGMPAFSQEEIKQRVWELGIAFSNSSSDDEKGKIIDDFTVLLTQFISYVSPDRKSLYEQAVKTIKQHSDGGDRLGFDHTDRRTLLDYLIAREKSGRGMKFDKAYPMAGGGTVTATMVFGGGASFDVSYRGEIVLRINTGQIRGNGVGWRATSAEHTMHRELVNHFDKAAGRAPIIWE